MPFGCWTLLDTPMWTVKSEFLINGFNSICKLTYSPQICSAGIPALPWPLQSFCFLRLKGQALEQCQIWVLSSWLWFQTHAGCKAEVMAPAQTCSGIFCTCHNSPGWGILFLLLCFTSLDSRNYLGSLLTVFSKRYLIIYSEFRVLGTCIHSRNSLLFIWPVLPLNIYVHTCTESYSTLHWWIYSTRTLSLRRTVKKLI